MPGSSLEGDLRSLGFDVRVASDTGDVETLLATVPADQRVAIVDTRFVGHVHALRLGLTDPRFETAALPGAVTVQAAARRELTRALARESSTASGGTAVAVDSVADRVAAALDADGASPYRPELGTLVAVVPTDPQARNEARQAVDAVDDEAVRLRTAVKSRDGFFTTYCISPYSRYIARWCARRGLTPNQVTTASLLTALIAAGCAATGTRGGFVAAKPAADLLLRPRLHRRPAGPLLAAVLHARCLARRHLRPRQGVRLLRGSRPRCRPRR